MFKKDKADRTVKDHLLLANYLQRQKLAIFETEADSSSKDIIMKLSPQFLLQKHTKGSAICHKGKPKCNSS